MPFKGNLDGGLSYIAASQPGGINVACRSVLLDVGRYIMADVLAGLRTDKITTLALGIGQHDIPTGADSKLAQEITNVPITMTRIADSLSLLVTIPDLAYPITEAMLKFDSGIGLAKVKIFRDATTFEPGKDLSLSWILPLR